MDTTAETTESIVTGKIVKVNRRGQVVFVLIHALRDSKEQRSVEQAILEADLFGSQDAFTSARAVTKVGTIVEARGTRSLSRSGVPSILISSLRAVSRDVAVGEVAEPSATLTTLYNDDIFFAISKPFDMPIGSIATQAGAVATPVSYLEQDVSGVVVLARSEEAVDLFQARMFHDILPSSEYVALVRGEPVQTSWSASISMTDDSGTEERNGCGNGSRVVHSNGESRGANEMDVDGCEAKIKNIPLTGPPKPSARICFQLVKMLPSIHASLICCRADACGGSYGIRRHLASIGHHVLGDQRFAHGQLNRFVKRHLGGVRMFFHLVQLSFRHLHTGQVSFIEDPVPQDLLEFLERVQEGYESANAPLHISVAPPPHMAMQLADLLNTPTMESDHMFEEDNQSTTKDGEGRHCSAGIRLVAPSSRTTKQRRAAAAQTFLHVLQKLLAGPESLQPKYSTNDLSKGLNGEGWFEGNHQISWSRLPAAVDPARGGHVPSDRSQRKQQQLENIVSVADPLLSRKKPLHVVDFCSGSGHLGLLLATLYPQHSYTLVDMSCHAIASAQERISSAGLRVRVECTTVAEFDEPFDLAVALHACGEASDLSMQLAVARGAAFVITPCCVGKVRKVCKDSSTKDGQGLQLLYPRSAALRSFLRESEYLHLVRAADYTHGVESCTGNQEISMERRQCKSFVERDRLLLAEESGFATSLAQMTPPSCTPKNDMLIGIPCDWDTRT